jgi:hypothetical protein
MNGPASQRRQAAQELFSTSGAMMTDAMRESAIALARMKLAHARHTIDRRRALDELQELIAGRSAAQVERMERTRGLK